MSLVSVVMGVAVQCSGPCGYWLNRDGDRGFYPEAAVYVDYGVAEEAAAAAGWFDGHDGRLAADPAKARLVPLCPRCRAAL